MSIIDILAAKFVPPEDNGIDVAFILEKKKKEADEAKAKAKLEAKREGSKKSKNKYVASKESSGFKSCNIFIADELLPHIDLEIEQSGGKLNRSDVINSILKEKYKNNNI